MPDYPDDLTLTIEAEDIRESDTRRKNGEYLYACCPIAIVASRTIGTKCAVDSYLEVIDLDCRLVSSAAYEIPEDVQHKFIEQFDSGNVDALIAAAPHTFTFARKEDEYGPES